MTSPTIQFKRGQFADLPDLLPGEPGFTTDRYDLFIGTDPLAIESNQFYGSGRYWQREDGSSSAKLNLVDKDGNKSLSFSSPNTLSGVGTFIFPDTTDGANRDFLRISSLIDGVYNLTWAKDIRTSDFSSDTLVLESEGLNSSDNDTSIPTTAAVKDYVDAQDLDVEADTGGPLSINLASEIFTIAGTVNEIETIGLGKTVTVGLPDDIVVGTSLSSPTIRTTTIEHPNTTQAASIDTLGNILAARDLTVTGDLFVNGDTTQINVETLTVEDTIIELGVINGNPPSFDLNKDLGILFNWYDTENRRAAVFWDDSVERIGIAKSVVETASVLDVASYAPVEIGELWINDAANASQVIRHNGVERILENITVDGGSF